MNYPLWSLWLTFLLSPYFSNAQRNCVLSKESEGIKVYLCDSEISNFKTIIVELDVPSNLSQYAALSLDIGQYKDWQYKAVAPRLLTQISNTELYYYSEVQTPWPTTNRDMIFHFNMYQKPEDKTLFVELTIYPDYLPLENGKVRIPRGHSVLTVTPIDKANVHVRYVLDIDPGGVVPAWIANMFAASAPWHTFKNFRDEIISQGDNRLTVPFIEDY